MRICLCDDDNIFLNYLSKLIASYFANHKNSSIFALRPDELTPYLESKSFPFDILITDIDMGHLSGIEFVKKINRSNPCCIIIFISNYINYATDVYDVKHIYFVLKTQIEDRLPKAINKALTIYNQRVNSMLTVQYQSNEFIIPVKDILYIEALGRYLYIHTIKESIKCIHTLKHIEKQLPVNYVRCHKSYILNLNHIKLVNRTECVVGNHSVPISQTFSKSFQSAYLQFISSKLL